MNKNDYNDAIIDFKIGFERGGRAINKSYASLASQALRDGNGRIMANYNKNNHVLDEIKSDIEVELSNRIYRDQAE